jgi:hypothetical protein
VATGTVYEPDGQSIGAVHFRVETLELAHEDPSALYVYLGPEQELNGRFSWPSGAPNSKRGGERCLVFNSGISFELVNPSRAEAFAEEGRPVTVKARALTPSPFSAHESGPFLWLLHVRATEP